MFKSFFPNPKWFFLSVILWFLINIGLWYSGGKEWGTLIGFPTDYSQIEHSLGVSRFWDLKYIWFYLWYWLSIAIFALFWKIKVNHPW